MCPSLARRLAILGAILASGVQPASALDFTLTGKLLRIKTSGYGNTLLYRSVDDFAGGQGVGSTGDPTCTGAGGGGGSLRVNGGGGNDFTIPLPCAGWRMIGGSNFNPDFRYNDPTGATCRTVHVKHGHKLRVQRKGPQMAYVLGTAQGNIDVTLRLGSLPDRNCSTFGPPPTQVLADGSNGVAYLAKDAPQPASCTSP